MKQAKQNIKIQKFLSQQGVCSRRQAEVMILAGQISVNGQLAHIGQKVLGTEKILVKGKLVKPRKKDTVLLAWHKPVGVEVTFARGKSLGNLTMKDFDFGLQKTITVGRLDKESRGILLITNDGNLANSLAHPSFGHTKEYEVKVDREIDSLDLKKLSNGSIKLGNKKILPCDVKKISAKKFQIILTEGRNRQIRKMCEACGLQVRDLLRVRFADFELNNLLKGEFKQVKIPRIFS